MARYMIVKIVLIGMIFFLGKATALAQKVDIKCEVSGFDFNLSGDDPGYFIIFGSFFVFAEGEQVKENEETVIITRFYKLPRTNLILSVFVIHYPKDETSLGPQLSVSMILGRKRVSVTSINLDEEGMLKDAVSVVNTWYPIKTFEEGFEGRLSTAFFGKREPVAITMRCKKEGK